MNPDPRRRRVTIGVDTHKHIHVAVALDAVGVVIETRSFGADRLGYDQLLSWAAGLGDKLTFAIEGTGSYRAGLTAAVRRRSIGVVEVMRADRRQRRLNGKSDTLDAENAVRSAMAGQSTGVPKTNYGTIEILRQVKIAKDTAVKARTAAMISIKQVLVNADPSVCEDLQALSKMALINRCVRLRPGDVVTVIAATKHTLRTLARRWQQLDEEIKNHTAILTQLTQELVPQLLDAFGIGADTALQPDSGAPPWTGGAQST